MRHEVWHAQAESKEVNRGADNRQNEAKGEAGDHPGYGKKGMGYLRDPERAVKNAVYKRTTFSITDLFRK
ncbi:hypothetical protein [Actinobaculum sp. 313]|uniref:hypothetical protein n=1 Tax=Actinobaculum sp. 313 TaxID=2495645 RepID=UPI001F0B82D4|nr:hypothetical protein [Actinobaculum sp. 313]